jgi:hypothetical protein
MLVPVAVAARFCPLTDSTFKPESTVHSKNKPILKELPFGPPLRGRGKVWSSLTDSENRDLVVEEDPE